MPMHMIMTEYVPHVLVQYIHLARGTCLRIKLNLILYAFDHE